jgi:peptidoglycan/xylan/chitin deacetylase (PgdA/CDA1 family)
MSDAHLVSLLFHGIGTPPADVPAAEVPYWCTRDAFCSLLDEVQDQEARGAGRYELTFDDGNTSDADVALPELTRREMTASFFVCTGRLGKDRYVDRDQAVALAAAGMIVGSHGRDHVNWRICDDATLDGETAGSRAMLEEVLGRPVTAVAIPFGSYDRRVLKAVDAAGYTKVYTSDSGPARASARLVARESVKCDWTPATLASIYERAGALPARLRQRAAQMAKSLR